MTTQQVADQGECKYHLYEVGFVWQIKFEFLRVAKRANLAPAQVLFLAMRPLKGMLSAHLTRNPHPECFYDMARLVEKRLGKVECVSWEVIMESAAGHTPFPVVGGVPPDATRHLENCTYCQRERRIFRATFPNYEEFYVK